MGNSAREVIEEIEACFRSLFPNIAPCKDYTCFEKSSIVDKNLEKVSQADYIFMIINEKFLLSPYCMKELYLILDFIDRNTLIHKKIEKFNEKVFLVVSDEAGKNMDTQNLEAHPKLRDAWLDVLKEKTIHYIDNKGVDKEMAKNIKNTIEVIENCIPFVRSMGNITTKKFNELKERGYADLMLEINKKMEDSGYRTFFSDLHDPEIEIINKTKEFKNVKEIEDID